MELNQKTLEELKKICYEADNLYDIVEFQYMGEECIGDTPYYYFTCRVRQLFVWNPDKEDIEYNLSERVFGYHHFDFIKLGDTWYLWRITGDDIGTEIVLGQYEYKEV